MTRKNIYELLPPLPAVVGEDTGPVINLKIKWDITKLDDGQLLYEGILSIPVGYRGNRLHLRFDRVGCEARVTVDGREIMKHYGGYTQWDCDITEVVNGKDKVHISLLLAGKEGELSPYQMAGIYGGMQLIAFPICYITNLSAQTKLGRNGSMELQLEYILAQGTDVVSYELDAVLLDSHDEMVLSRKLPIGSYQDGDIVNSKGTIHKAVIECYGVALWDSEHPNLYKLKLGLKKEGKLVEEVHRQIGFRNLERIGNQVVWNGKPIKLRGICYREPLSHEIGRDVAEELRLLKNANVNYIRGLYYPFSTRVLDLCDQMGFYVEQSAAVCEVDQTVSSTQNMPEYKDAYMGQFADTLIRDRSHVSILLWLLGNDSTWGSNFREEYRLVKSLDDIRLVNFHYPMTIPEEETQMDVWSVHYASYKLPLDACYDQMVIGHTQGSHNEIGYATGCAPDYDMPVLHDAYAHIPCYNRDQIDRDPGIHEFWGESIKRFWDRMWVTKGCLGGAVMAAVDENGSFTDNLKDHLWGILSADSQLKPEYYHVRMAYSPIVIVGYEITKNCSKVTIENRFNHTNLNEVELRWSCNGIDGTANLEAAPYEIVEIILPVTVQRKEKICLGFYHKDSLIMEYQMDADGSGNPLENYKTYSKTSGGVTVEQNEHSFSSYTLTEDMDKISLDNGRYSFTFRKDSKLLVSATAGNKVILTGGPCIQTTRLKLNPWRGQDLSVNITEQGAVAVIEGEYGDVMKVRFILRITNEGVVDTECEVLALSKPMPHTVKANIGIDCGGLDEMGIWYLLSPEYENFRWQRRGLWSCYPDYHIGRTEGSAQRSDGVDFRSMKQFILDAVISNPMSQAGVEIHSNGCHSIRLESVPDPAACIDDRDERIIYHGDWYEMDDYCGNYMDTETLSGEKGNSFKFTFTGTGIRVYGPTDYNYGICDIYLDGELVKKGVSQYPAKVDFPAMSRGYEKRYQLCLYSVHGLADTEHTIHIVVCGEKESGAQNTYVSLDYIVVEGPQLKDSVKMIINNDFNYTRLVRGNYMREKVDLKTGDILLNRIKLLEPKKYQSL